MEQRSFGRLVPSRSSGNRADSVIEVMPPRVTIGRAADNTVVLTDREVSKYHAELVVEGHRVMVADLGSANGTSVNGVRVRRKVLNQGDQVAFGACLYHYDLADSPEASLFAGTTDDHTSIHVARPAVLDAKDDELTSRAEAFARLQLAFTALADLLDSVEVTDVAQRILAVAFELVPAESGVVLLFDHQGVPHPWATRSIRSGSSTQLIVSRTLIDRVLADRTGLLATDALNDQQWGGSASIVRGRSRSLLVVPLVSRGEIYGVLHLAHSAAVGAFSSEHLDLLMGLGQGAGTALRVVLNHQRLAEEARMRDELGRFLSPVVVARVLDGGSRLARGGEQRHVTVMFADIRGFTGMAERMEPSSLVATLNEYFDQMVEVIFDHGGLLDKFIGDAIMAVWGVPDQADSDAKMAVTAAHEMLNVLRSLNDLRRDRREDPLNVGIGLATGTVVAGNLGARTRLEFTVIGDTVNVASRLAGLAQSNEIWLDGETYRRAGSLPGANALPRTSVKGRSQAVEIFRYAL